MEEELWDLLQYFKDLFIVLKDKMPNSESFEAWREDFADVFRALRRGRQVQPQANGQQEPKHSLWKKLRDKRQAANDAINHALVQRQVRKYLRKSDRANLPFRPVPLRKRRP